MREAFVLVLALVACDSGGPAPVDGGDYQVGTIHLHVASGAAVISGGYLMLVLSDQPNTCEALAAIPRQKWVNLSLKVAPTTGGMTQAAIVAAKPSPGAGEAVGSIAESTAGVPGASYDAASGSVAWTPHAAGSCGSGYSGSCVTVESLDAGFAGTSDRVVLTAALTVPSC